MDDAEIGRLSLKSGGCTSVIQVWIK